MDTRWLTMTAQQITDQTRDWSPERKRQLLAYLRAANARQRVTSRVHHPAELLKLCDPSYKITPAVDLVSRAVERVLWQPNRNLLVTAPPQELKSTLCAVGAPVRALQINPNRRIMLLTYADELAQEHSLVARDLIMRCGSGATDDLTGDPVEDRLGLSLRQDRHAVGRWRVNEGIGGLLAAGLGSTITGRPADLIIIDDPYKNMMEADSAAFRARVLSTYRTVVHTRRAPGCSVILVQTRWHPSDLAGHILEEEANLPRHMRTWRYLNIPAVSCDGVPDALHRPEPGIALESARGRTAEEFEQTRRTVGERVWFALYQGVPTPPEGGLFSRKWFDNARLDQVPQNVQFRVVAVDPAETGKRDEAGVVAAALLGDGKVVLTHDRSGNYTSEQWAMAAVELAMEIGAREISVEAYTAADTYVNVVKRLIAVRLADVLTSVDHKRYLRMLKVVKWRGTGDAVARSALLRQACETGTVAVQQHEMVTFEEQAVSWQVGSHQPDRVAAAVIAHNRIMLLIGRSTDVASPLQSISRQRAGRSWLERKVG